MSKVTVYYDGGMILELDDALRSAANMVKGSRSLGSGQMLQGPLTRDLSWEIPASDAQSAFAEYAEALGKLVGLRWRVNLRVGKE